jgi:hypothetical protein
MKRRFITVTALLLVAAVILVLPGCYGINVNGNITGSQDLETREFNFTDFNSVEIMSPFQVEIARSNVYLVSITANDNLFDYIEVTQVGDTLRIRLRPFFSFRSTTLRASIAMPDLSVLDMSGASSVNIAGFQTNDDVEINVSGASRLDILSLQAVDVTMEISGASRATGFVKCESANFEVSGASYLELNGSAEGARLDASGASSLRLQDFYLLHASVILSGASNGNVEVNGTLDVDISGASRLVFGGNPQLGKVDVTSASSLSRR